MLSPTHKSGREHFKNLRSSVFITIVYMNPSLFMTELARNETDRHFTLRIRIIKPLFSDNCARILRNVQAICTERSLNQLFQILNNQSQIYNPFLCLAFVLTVMQAACFLLSGYSHNYESVIFVQLLYNCNFDYLVSNIRALCTSICDRPVCR